MKKTILLIIALITGIYSANAQYKKGDIELGGEIAEFNLQMQQNSD